MTDNDIRRVSLDALRAMDEAGDLRRPADAPDGEDLGEDFWKGAVLHPPRTRNSVSITLSPAAMEFFEREGPDPAEAIRGVLEAYAAEHSNS